MTDPYIILGVPRNASEEQVRAAYKKLALKYHSEQIECNEEKMAEIDAAYDQIIKTIKMNPGKSGEGASSHSSVSEYADVRRLISAKRLDDAEQILDGVQPSSRNSEWNYLKGYILLNRGWLEEATSYITKAYKQDPFNAEYKNMYDTINNQKNGYNGGYNPGIDDVGLCSICSSILCADACCECCNGDLVPCC